MQPGTPVALGQQGSERGSDVAYLRVTPVRWDAVSGRLELVRSMKVRITVEPVSDPGVVKRERIVREWEDELPAATLARDGARITSLARPGGKSTPFAPTQIPSVLGSPVAYVIVTSDELAPQFQRLADWKTQEGVPAVVRTLTFVRQQYPFGADDADRIRQFIRDAYSRWGTKWVLLGGDTDVIPTRYAFTTFYGGEAIATDLYFSCLDGNWNADGDSIYGEGYQSNAVPGDSCDLLPDVYVGRAPVSTVSQAQTFVDKTFQYTRTPAGDYEHQDLFFAEVLFPHPWTGGTPSLDGAEIVEQDLPHLQTNPNVRFARLYQNYTDPRWLPGSLPESRAVVLDSLDVGYNISCHVGHGYRNVMECADASITNADALSLTNGNRVTNLYAADCTSNAIDFPCIGEAFLHATNGGAVTNVGSSRFDFPVAGRDYQEEYFRLFYEDSVTAVGELQARQKLPFVVYASQDYVHRWTQMTLLLLGDPELRMWITHPRTLTVTAPAAMTLGDSTMTVNVKITGTPLYGARVTLYKTGDDYASGTTDGAGNVTLAFRPDTLGTAMLTVTGLDCRPVQDTIAVNPSAAAVLANATPTFDDDNAGGTVGNGNGIPDAGETVDMTVPIRNNGGTTAPGVNARLATTDPRITVVNPVATYGTVLPGLQVNGTPYRITLPYDLNDQREVPFTLSVVDGAGHHVTAKFQITTRSPELHHFGHTITEVSGGNGNARPDPSETIDQKITLINLGTGIANGVTAILRNYDGKATVTDSTATFGDLAAGASVTGDAFRYGVISATPTFELRVSDNYGLLWTQTIDTSWPATPSNLAAVSGATTISLTWSHNLETDLIGYNVYRSTGPVGPFTKVNAVPTDRTSYYLDEALQPLTKYYYRVSAVDSSGNESGQTASIGTTTTPPNHAIFPIATRRNTPASVAVARIYNPGQMDIVVGSDVLYVFHQDGSAPVDADGDIVSSQGDFTTLGSYYAAGPSVAALDPGAGFSIIGTTWDTQSVYVFDTAGHLRPGWPFNAGQPIWSCAAVGDLDGDGHQELIFGSNGYNIFALRSNGIEWMDGDANPSTQGVFKVLPVNNNFSTPALADLDGDGKPEIIYAGFGGTLYAWKANGANVPGFPVFLGGTMSMSPAVGYLDGPGDTTPEIVAETCGSNHDSLYVIEPNGSRRTGFPVYLYSEGTSKQPSPALADMNNDGFLDIVTASTSGQVQVFDRNGVSLPLWANSRYSKLFSSSSESSPVVADIDGDGIPDVVMGDENTELAALSGATGQMMPGFPIKLDGEVRGTPALCDCDGDGKTEIVLSGWDTNVYVWDYDFPFNPNGLPAWPQFHHDAMRSGFASGPTLLAAPDPAADLPRTLAFSAPAPNPLTSGARFSWAVPSDDAGGTFELAIFDLSGRRLKTVAAGNTQPGRFTAQWSRRGDDGSLVGAGVYFARLRVGGKSLSRKLVVLP